MAICYMVYTSSYIIAPFILTFMAFSFVKDRSISLIPFYGKALIIFFAALSPFLLYAARIDNFFMQRVDQVSLFSGTWRSQQEIFYNIDSFLQVLIAHTSKAVQSLFLLGMVIMLYQGIRRGSLILFIFPTAIVLTIHPPPFHRWSIAYPLIGLSIAHGMFLILIRIRKVFPHPAFSYGILVMLLILFAANNLMHALSMIERDKMLKTQDIINVSQYIKANISPHIPIYIAAFPANAFGKELVFSTVNAYPITTTYFENLPIQAGDGVLIVHRPDEESMKKVFDKFPNASIISNLKLRDYTLIRL